MKSNNPELRLLVRILSIVGAVIICLALAAYIFLRIKAPHLLEFSEDIQEYRITVPLDSLEGARFVTGMNGCENIALAPKGHGLYVTCLDGYIHYLNGAGIEDLAIRKSVKVGTQAQGVTFGKDGNLYAAIVSGSPDEWITRGGAIWRLDSTLEVRKQLTAAYPAINGVTSDSAGNIYFASSNFEFLDPAGKIYKMPDPEVDSLTAPRMILEDAGLSNGLYYDRAHDKIYYSNTIVGVYDFSPEKPVLHEDYLKLRFMEACDDLCTDISGNLWMTDPGYSTVKMYNPGTDHLVRFIIQGMGQTSSCRIRTEDGQEVLYISEMKKTQKPMRQEFDGRGVLVVPTRSLIRLLKPILTRNKT